MDPFAVATTFVQIHTQLFGVLEAGHLEARVRAGALDGASAAVAVPPLSAWGI